MATYRNMPEELRERAKEEINEIPERIPEDLQHIKEWLKKQPHLNVRQDDQWLLAFLRGCKFSLERTKEKLDFFYTMRTMIPEFFENRDPMSEEIQTVIKQGIFLPLLTNDPNLPRFILLRSGAYDPSKISFQQVLKTNMMFMDLAMMEDDFAPVNGVRIIQDMKGITLAHMTTPTITKKAMTIFQEAYPNRIKGLHFVNTPGFFETIYSLFRPFLTEKMKNRVNVHGSDLESLYKVVPKEILPKEYGGGGDSIEEITAKNLKSLESYRQWFLEDSKYKSDESKRPGKPKSADEMFGIEGSFRKLNVD